MPTIEATRAADVAASTVVMACRAAGQTLCAWFEFGRLVRNVYKVLLTRGKVGTVLYSPDPETSAMLRTLIGSR